MKTSPALRTTGLGLIPVGLLLLGACAGPKPLKVTGPLAVSGTVTGLKRPQHARIAIYRVSLDGVVERMHGADANADDEGRFESEPLNPASYIFALRAPGRPVSIVRVPVPPALPITLVARPPLGPARLMVSLADPSSGPRNLLLSRVEEGVPVVDRRAITVADPISIVEGLSVGRWRLDVLGTGATTEIEIPAGARRLTLDLVVPEIGVGPEMKGNVIRADGGSAQGLAVTVRPLAADGTIAQAWGRYALTDSDGGYHLIGLPPGRALIRLESRDAVFRRLPSPEIVVIPPSGRMDRSFVVYP